MKKALYPCRIKETLTLKEGYKTMKKYLSFPGEIILQFLQLAKSTEEFTLQNACCASLFPRSHSQTDESGESLTLTQLALAFFLVRIRKTTHAKK